MYKTYCITTLLILQFLFSIGCYDSVLKINTQETYFDDGTESFGIEELYYLQSDTIKNYLGKKEKVKIPQGFNSKQLCWGDIYFTGIKKMKWKNTVPFILADYDKANPVMVVDKNSNFDFTDDSVIVITPKEPFYIDLKNIKYPKGIFKERLCFYNDNKDDFFSIKPGNSDRYRKRVPLNFIIKEKRFNYRKAMLPDSNIITLHDYNCNGLYDDEEGWFGTGNPDRIFAGDIQKNPSINLNPVKAKKIKAGIRLPFKNNTYSLKEVDKSGIFIKISALNIISDTIEKIPRFVYYENGITKSFQFSARKEFTVLHFWGVWCPGCVASMPYVMKYEKENKEQLDIYHFNHGDSKEVLSRYMMKSNLSFSPWRIDIKNVESLGVYGYPNFIVLNKRGEVVFRNLKFVEVMKFIKEKRNNK
jgi:thiol-disulfide isomerase/thioredoxin